MIDPKQKAVKTAEKFLAIDNCFSIYSSTAKELNRAKKCAKIHVEGIIEALPSSSKNTFKGKSKLSIYEEWQEVLNELASIG